MPPGPSTHSIKAFRFGIPWIVKTTPRTTSTEAHALRFLHSTGLDRQFPIPRLRFSFVEDNKTYTVMTRMPGTPLYTLQYSDVALSSEFKETVLKEVVTLIEALQTLRQSGPDTGKVMMSTSGHNLPDPRTFFDSRAGPFPSIIDLWRHCSSCDSLELFAQKVDEPTRRILAADPIRFVHPDLRTYNVLIENGHISGFVDWEDSGWFPSCWQVWCMRRRCPGCDMFWCLYFRQEHRFSDEAEAAYAASSTFLEKFPV